jgi:predicted O-methyltransferase YrrM
MNFREILKRMVQNSDQSIQRLREIVAGVENQSHLFNEKHREIIEGLNNQSQLQDSKFQALMEGLANQTQLLNEKLTAIIQRQDALAELHKNEMAVIRKLLSDRGNKNANLSALPAWSSSNIEHPKAEARSIDTALATLPLMIADKTYNTSHPKYDASLVRNFPGKIQNPNKSSGNIVYKALRQFSKNGEIADTTWNHIIEGALNEAMAIPHANEVFSRRTYIQDYLKKLSDRYGAHYVAGSINQDDAAFLYWLVRQLKPTTVVQTGVCNGLSSAFLVLALVKNGSGGKLHAIDIPPIFDSNDGGWTLRGQVYGQVIPEGKSSGWMIPDPYRGRFELYSGDAKALLPKLVDKIDSIDLFYHDSNHTYDHMMFEFGEAKRKLAFGGLIVADDIAWNSAIWDFADQHVVPAYNFKGAIGVAFF